AQAFAQATGQIFNIYYAEDTVGQKQVTLTGQNAEDTWNTPIKADAHDFSEKLSLVIGMPVFVINNIAVKLGVSNGSRGTLISVDYKVKAGRHYAISALVDLLLYTSLDSTNPFPHRITIPV
ncbi:hypothetical protein C8J56DRAFT_757145, partial [Mycena floridula]